MDKIAEERKREKGKHAAGTFERQDAYLYGHPQGRKKRFRSPADFFPHLLWLCVDKESDPRNCSCKICSPEGDEDPNDEIKPETSTKKEIKPASTTVAANQRSMPVSQQAQTPKPTFQPPVLVAPTKSLEQKADSDPNSKYLYRPGELVWFYNGMNWRLGVISKRALADTKPRYLIQPLSNPFQHQPAVVKDDEGSLRPWLAWSVPDTTLPGLKDMIFDTVPWERVTAGDFDEGQPRDYVVDGSILAAKVVDASYSLFDRNEAALTGPNEVNYNGMFLGAEKIWVGEPVRLRSVDNEIIVMIIQKLVEKTVPPATSIVTFVGDVYKFVEMPNPYTDMSQWPTPDLPARMIVDLRFRNEVAHLAKRGVWHEWRLLEPAARKSLMDVKGRWYETRTLLPVLRGVSEFQQDLKSGKTSDSGEWMNGRRDKNLVPEQRRKNRRDTLGKAVPEGFKVSRGLDGEKIEDMFPDELLVGVPQQQQQQLQNQPQLQLQPQRQQQQQQQQQQHGFAETDLDQFMDLDGVGSGNGFFTDGLGH